VIFVPKWPKWEFVSFISFILLTKSLSCNVCCLNMDNVYFRVFRYSEFISLIWKGSYYDKFQCHKLQEGNFRVPGRFCERFQLSKSWVPCFRPDGPVKCLDTLLSAQHCICPDVRATHPDTLQCWRRIHISFADKDRERQLATVRTLWQIIWMRP
jgi:hypothetical protein